MAPANGSSVKCEDIRHELNNNNVSSSLNKNNNNNNGMYDHEGDLEYDSDHQTTCNNKMNNNNDNSYNNGKTNLIVNYLPQPMTDAEFTKLFEKYGTIKTAKIVRHKVTGYSYGFGFVDFQTNAEALRAIDGLNGHELDNKKIKVAFARPAGQDIKQANLYVKNVPNSWTQDDVRKLFEPFGDIIQCRVLGNSRGVAFVLFNLRKEAEDALKALKGTTVDGGDNPLEIKFAADNAQKVSGQARSSNNNNSNNNNSNSKGQQGSNDRHNNRATHNQQRNKGSTFIPPYQQQRPQPQLMQQNFYQPNDFYSQQQPFENYMGQPQGLRVQSQYTVPYGGNIQPSQFVDNYSNYGATPIGSPGPIRQPPTVRQNRYAPFTTPQQTHISPIQVQQTGHGYQYPQDPRLVNPYNQSQQQQLMPIETQTPVHIPGLNIYGTTQSSAPMPEVMDSQQFMSRSRTPMGPALVHQTNYGQQSNLPQVGVSSTGDQTTQNAGNASGNSDATGVTLFVYNIGSDGDENLLKDLFSSFGPVLKCNVVRKSPSQECKGYGFVTLADEKQANAAIQRMNGYIHKNGRALQVSLKKNN